MPSRKKSYDFLKRGIDIVGSGIGLVVLSPVIGAVSLAVRTKLGSPVIFQQRRPGKDGEIFTLYKFRTMLDMNEAKGIVTNEQRMTSFGRRLRSLSLDELPTLMNVLRGNMSLVGPRPLRTEYLSQYSPQQARRHEVRPGITGLAQIKGRNSLPWEERFKMDVDYVESRSLRVDSQILMNTLFQVFRRSGIEGDGMAAMSAFVADKPVDSLTEEPLSEEWLETRVQWLNDPGIREGITISFEANITDTYKWFESVNENLSRRDWVYLNELGEPVAMAGLSGVGTPDLTLYIYVGPSQQGNGYGGMVINRLIYRARTYGGYRLRIEVKQSNEIAMKLYEKRGFERVEAPEREEHGKYVYVLQLKDEK